jgi:CheY-like chemotaxis protein
MKILIVDPNLVFAKKVKSMLSEYTRNVDIHIATNVPVLKRRLTEHQYDLIIAEVMAIVEADRLLETLHQVDTPKLLWTVADTDTIKEFKNIVRKPTSEQMLRDMIERVIPVPA